MAVLVYTVVLSLTFSIKAPKDVHLSQAVANVAFSTVDRGRCGGGQAEGPMWGWLFPQVKGKGAEPRLPRVDPWVTDAASRVGAGGRGKARALTPLFGHVGPSHLTGPPKPSHWWRWPLKQLPSCVPSPVVGLSFFPLFMVLPFFFFFLLVCFASPFLFSPLISLCSPFPPPLIFPSDLCGSRPAQSFLGPDSQQDGQQPGTSLTCSSQGCPASVHLLPLPWCFFFFPPLVFLILDPGPESTPEKKVGLSEVSPQCRRDCLPAG